MEQKIEIKDKEDNWKIGEIRQVNGEWCQCVVALQGCRECSFRTQDYCTSHSECMSLLRSDGRSVIFKKLEKVGEPFERNGYLYQEYKAHTYPLLMNGEAKLLTANGFAVKIKQNKEDMEEKNKAEGLPLLRLVGKYMNSLINYATFEKAVKDLYSNKEESKPTLKEFDLEAAKAGKPVCTRDGRKARIICFDRIDSTGCNLPIVALVQCEETEVLQLYHDNGKCDAKADLDLMMLPEKKEGWVNIYRGQVYNAFEKAEEARKIAEHGGDNYLKTIKIEWEE